MDVSFFSYCPCSILSCRVNLSSTDYDCCNDYSCVVFATIALKVNVSVEICKYNEEYWLLELLICFDKYQGRLINKLQNGVFWLIFKLLKIRNIRFVWNLFLYSPRNFYNSDIIMTSECLKHSHPVKYPPAATTLLGLVVTSKNEQLKQIWVNFCLFKTSYVNFWHHGFIYQHILQLYLNISTSLLMPNAENEVGCCASHWRRAHCTSISEANFYPPSVFFIGSKRW